MASVGASVASASDARLSIIRFTHSCVRKKATLIYQCTPAKEFAR